MENIEKFFSSLKEGPPNFGPLPFDNSMNIVTVPAVPWYSFAFPDFDHLSILNELESLKSIFVEHRPDEGHKGWKSLSLHGCLDAFKTMCPEDYGIKEEEAIYHWTEIADKCPITTRYFQAHFPSESYRRIRFMLVEPGGYILPHRDRERNYLGPLSIAVNAPDQCAFGLENHGIIPIQAGGFYLIDISNRHCVWNQSSRDRYHITVEVDLGSQKQKYLEMLIKYKL